MYATIKNGMIGQADPNSDTVDFQIVPPRVTEGSVVLSTAEAQIEAQILDDKRQRERNALRQARRDIRNASIRSEYAFAQKMNRESMTPDTLSNSERQIRDSIMRGSTKNPDFSQLEALTSKGDFGSRADFEQHEVIGNPLRSDGRIGPVTDYDRFVRDRKYDQWRATSTGPMGSRQLSLADRIATGESSMCDQSMGSWLSDVTGINLDVSDKIDEALPQLEEQAAQYLTTQGPQIIQGILPSQQAQAQSSTPAPIRALQNFVATQTTGAVTLPVVGRVEKKYLFYGGLALLAIGLTGYFVTRRLPQPQRA